MTDEDLNKIIVVGQLASAADIVTQQKAEEDYKEGRRRAEAALHTTRSGIMVTVPEGFWDKVERPAHYCAHRHTHVEIIQDWELDFFLGSVVKYIERHKLKGDPEGDLRKAKKFLEMKIELLEKGRLEGTISHG